MTTSHFNFDQLRNLSIGTVDFVSPIEIKVLLETDAPQNTALNTGVPSLFPRINGFVLIPNEVGALVGIISWLGVEHSQYPKRKGFKDYDLIDLPFPLRKIAVNPIGTLKTEVRNKETIYKLERGIYSFPSIGDTVVLPKDEQLRSIVENDDDEAYVKIGVAPVAGNAIVKINPNKLFGRHIAVLGNTGSGKSCSAAGLIRWSLQEASKHKKDPLKSLNSRFIVFDPNGEYARSFEDLDVPIKRFKIEIATEEVTSFQQLRIPAWFWNSYEWSSFTLATGRTQRPILRRALRELKGGVTLDPQDCSATVRSYFSSCSVSLRSDINIGVASFKEKPGKNDFGRKIQSYSNEASFFEGKATGKLQANLKNLADTLQAVAAKRYKTFVNDQGQTIEYYDGFEISEATAALDAIKALVDSLGGESANVGPNEDMPVDFHVDLLPNHLEVIAEEQGVIQFLDFLIMRVRTLLSDSRMKGAIGNEPAITLEEWLSSYLSGITVIDLSLIPADIVHIVVASISRMSFEAIQRYRRMTGTVLPTVIMLEEAHNFIKKYTYSNDEISPLEICSQTFEKIAKEGRKFGMSLFISSQRPSELSDTVLSQCNTFLLHRLVNDRDQDLVRRLVPDNIGGLLSELPMLPTRKAIILGWAAPIPILVEMNELEKKYRPKSDDPDFWEVWTGQSERKEDWKAIADEWQGKVDLKEDEKHESPHTDALSNDNPGDDDLPF
ncbi:ATP-binding protein [Algoriphagus terrigena]|uniref:ATP-binding protein n=1 Tax=Algoriphagus terrigena TaxID=344884 RepID=UPI0004005FD7|nr:ATP-binding protein [Algoriphagus terrigena]